MKTTGTLDGARVVVTGSSSGIGRALVDMLLDAGASVIGISRKPEAPAAAGDRFVAAPVDLADLDAAEAALDELARRHDDVTAVISNAGAGPFGALEQLSAAQIRRGIDLNLTSHLLVARAFLPGMKARGGGDLLFTGSVSGRRGARNGSVYCAAKFGLRGLALSLRDECARAGVRVTLVAPGPVDSRFFDDLDFAPKGDGSALQPEDVARTMLFVLRSPRHVVFDEIDLSAPHHSMERKPRS